MKLDISKITRPFAFLLLGGIVLAAPSCSLIPRSRSTQPAADKVTITRDPITLEYWRLFDDSEALDPIIEAYQKDHPNINIVVRKVDLKANETIYDYQADLIKKIADGNGPDMFMIHNDWLPYQVNQLSPMPTGLMSIGTYQDTFPDVVQQDFLTNNRIYAIPFSIDNLMLFYNTKIFDEKKIKSPPRTLAELVSLVPKLTEFDTGGRFKLSAIPLGASEGIPRAADILATLMMQYGADMTSVDKKTATFELPAPDRQPPFYSGAEALAFYTQFADPKSPYYTYTDAKDAQGNRLAPVDIQAFMEGKAAMFIGYSYNVSLIRKSVPNLRFNTATLPQNQPQNPVTLANYWGETVSRTSKHPTEAWDFIRYASSKRNQSVYTQATGRVSARKDTYTAVSTRFYYGPVVKQVEYSKAWYRKNSIAIEGIFARMIDSVVKSGVDARTAVQAATRDINNLPS